MKLSIKRYEDDRYAWTILATSKKGQQWEYDSRFMLPEGAIAKMRTYICSGMHKKSWIKHDPNWKKYVPENKYPPEIVAGSMWGSMWIDVSQEPKKTYLNVGATDQTLSGALIRNRCQDSIRMLLEMVKSGRYDRATVETIHSRIRDLIVEIDDTSND